MATPAEKQAQLEKLLEHGVVMVHLDARQPGVKVPAGLKTEVDSKLNFNHQKGRGDLRVSSGASETLRFRGEWFPVSVPWCAVYLLAPQGEDPIIFAEDFPEELIERAMVKLQQEGHSLEDLEERRPRSVWANKNPVAPAPQAKPEPVPGASPDEPEAKAPSQPRDPTGSPPVGEVTPSFGLAYARVAQG